MTPEQWKIVLGGVLGGHFPHIDRPGTWLTGPSGAGKTTRGRMLAGWIDPAKYLGGRLNIKRDERDARTRAMHRYIVTMDNVSVITQDESDFWCTLHTGVSDSVRQLHSDNMMLTYEYKRIGLGTSVTMPDGFQPDALRRMLHIELEASERHPDAGSLWQRYEEIRPEMLGALYTVLAAVLENLAKAMAEELPECPEMSAYARRLFAADLAYPGLGLYKAYCKHAGDVMIDKGISSPLVRLIDKMMDMLQAGGKTSFSDTPTALYKLLENLAGVDAGKKWWPANEDWLSRRLTEFDAPLRRLGIVVERHRTGKTKTITITRGNCGVQPGPSDAIQALVTP